MEAAIDTHQQSHKIESTYTPEIRKGGFFELMNKLGDYVLNLVPISNIFGKKRGKNGSHGDGEKI